LNPAGFFPLCGQNINFINLLVAKKLLLDTLLRQGYGGSFALKGKHPPPLPTSLKLRRARKLWRIVAIFFLINVQQKTPSR